MDYIQALKDGLILEAQTAVENEVRKQPGNVAHRIFLFQLLLIQAQWERAAKQLDVISRLDDGALAMVHMYHAAISCELFREAVFKGTHEPVFMGEPENWQALLLQSFKLATEAKYSESELARSQAFELAPTSSGMVNGSAFEWIADADSRLGPVLEMIVEGKYLWVSFSHIDALTIEVPVDLRDLVWIPAHVKWNNGGEAHALIPARYPNSEAEPGLSMGRRTEWLSYGQETYVGLGQKILTTDVDEYPLMDIREIKFISDGFS